MEQFEEFEEKLDERPDVTVEEYEKLERKLTLAEDALSKNAPSNTEQKSSE